MSNIKSFLCYLLLLFVYNSSLGQDKALIIDSVIDDKGILRFFRISGAALASKTDYFKTSEMLKSKLKANEYTEFKLVRFSEKEKGKSKMLFQQYFKGVPVYDGYYNVHLEEGIPQYCNGEFNKISNIANAIQINLEAAIKIGVSNSQKSVTNPPTSKKGELVLFRRDENDSYRYAYKVVIIYSDAYSSRELLIDAATGNILSNASLICHTNTPGTADTRYSGSRTITGDSFAGGFRLRQNFSGINISTLNNQFNSNVNAVDFVDNDNAWSAAEHGVNQVATDVHWGTERFLDYFRTTFNRNGFDNNNFPVTSYIHRTRLDNLGNNVPMDDAFFNPNDGTFSYGDGSFFFTPLTSLDVVAHELGHGFSFFEIGFNNTGEPRSLNEGFSDIWGAIVENAQNIPGKNAWLIGEEVIAFGGANSLRSLRNPNQEGLRTDILAIGNYPDTRLGNFWNDNVNIPHINATVLGHWFFRLSEGGNGINDLGNAFNITGVGIQTAAQIVYNTQLALTPSADFMAVRVASIAYATATWGANSCQTIAVTRAWFAVGVGADWNGGNAVYPISGTQYMCTPSSTYSITGLPPNANVTWATTPNYTTITPNGNTALVTRQAPSVVSGQVTLTATIDAANSCSGTTATGQKIIYLGGSLQSGTVYGNPYNVYDNAPWGTWNIVNYGWGSQPFYIEMSRYSTWSAPSGPVSSWWTTSYPHRMYIIPSMPGFTIPGNSNVIRTNVSSYNECGNFISNITYFQNQTQLNHRAAYTVFPNPTNGNITISAVTDNTATSKETAVTNTLRNKAPVKTLKISLLNNLGTVLKEFSEIITGQTINLSGFAIGLYYLKIFDGETTTLEKVIIQ